MRWEVETIALLIFGASSFYLGYRFRGWFMERYHPAIPSFMRPKVHYVPKDKLWDWLRSHVKNEKSESEG